MGQKCFYPRKTRTRLNINRYGNILRFPRAAGEPPRANALRGLTLA